MDWKLDWNKNLIAFFYIECYMRTIICIAIDEKKTIKKIFYKFYQINDNNISLSIFKTIN